MGMYDSVIIKCPNCDDDLLFQSKGAEWCSLEVYDLDVCPEDVLSDVNRHAPVLCECGVSLKVDIPNRTVVIVSPLNSKP